MSTPTPATPKGPRSARRNPKKGATPNSSAVSQSHGPQAVNLSPPSYTSPRNLSPDGLATEDSSASFSESTLRKKKCRPGNKKKDGPTKPYPVPNGPAGHRHTSSHPSAASPPTLRDSPHYAGPTFHASPAPSALPIPTFFSKSVPDSDLGKPDDLEDDASPEASLQDSTPTKAKTYPLQSQDAEGTSSPLDFLFKAARNARLAQSGEPDRRSGQSSPSRSDTKLHPVSPPPEGPPGSMFPLELDSSDTQNLAIGPSFATPYKDRMNALRSASTPSTPSDMADDHRRAKTEALKDLLLNPRPQRSAASLSQPLGPSNIFGSKTSTPNNVRSGDFVGQPSSGPSTPVSFDGSPHMTKNIVSYQYQTSVYTSGRTNRTPSSHLRQEVFSSTPSRSPHFSPARGHHVYTSSPFSNGERRQHLNASDLPLPAHSGMSPIRGLATGTKATDVKRMEDDLRRILKLDANDGRRSTEIESTVA
ncbi:hypothetical protein AJ80_02734 [Polytolypa hystricis UAMH7299]|uniref:Proteophosphoglycan 5 n=1 Tax=Polytolypa hystricis (strain UAMH7299) TaxID=1447883 RepID=A0A2B7YGJ1_POLH7|nr:hypothetical protein AJ80_02734 [Polytolypa hystricis UAMH7299]